MYNLINLNQIIDARGESAATLLLSTFSSKNEDVQAFVQKNAVDFAVKKIAVTYLILSEENDMLGMFTLANKNMTIPVAGLSRTQEKRIQRYAVRDNEGDKYTSPAILIAQFSKNSNIERSKSIQGTDHMMIALDKVRQVQNAIGGKLVWLECESDNENAMAFYRSSDIDFREFARRKSSEGTIYVQMLKWL